MKIDSSRLEVLTRFFLKLWNYTSVIFRLLDPTVLGSLNSSIFTRVAGNVVLTLHLVVCVKEAL